MTEYTSAATSCLAVISNTTIANNCDAVTSSVTDHFLEACIREYERAGSEHATTILQYSLIYYCVVVTGVNECSFDRYFYFCDDQAPEDSGFAIWMILVLVIVLFILITAIIVVIRCKKKKSQKDEHGTTLISRQGLDRAILNMYDNEATTETSFMKETHIGIGATALPHAGRDSPGQWSQSSRRQSIISTHDFFESPIMFIGSPPMDTLAYEDGGNVHIGSPPPTDQHISPLRKFFRKKSIGPSHGHVEHIHVHSASQDRLSNPLSSNQMKSTVTEMLQKARESESPQSPHPQPNYSASAVFRDQQTPVPTFSADAPKSLFGTTSPEPKFGETTEKSYAHPTRLGTFTSSAWAKPNQKFPRNIHASSERNEHVHTTSGRSTDSALPILKDDSFISDSRGATPGEQGISTKSQKGNPQIESTTPWSKYTATLPPPMGKATEGKNTSKGEPKTPKVKNRLDSMDRDEII